MKVAPKLWTTFTDETNTTYSFARVSCGVLLIVVIIWGSYIVWLKGQLPDFTTTSLLFGAIYGVSRAGEVTQKVLTSKSNGNGDKK